MADAQSSPPQRLSRYRSQRRAQQQAQTDTTPDVPKIPQQEQEQEQEDNGVVRSKSRYHRKNTVSDHRPATAPSQGQRPTSAVRSRAGPPHETAWAVSSRERPQDADRKTQDAGAARSAVQAGARHAPQSGSDGCDAQLAMINNRQTVETGTNQQAEHLRTQFHRPPNAALLPSQASGELFPPWQDTIKPVAKTLRADGPPTSDQIRATKSTSELPRYVGDDDGGGGCFGLFKRKRGEGSSGEAKEPIARSSQTGRDLQVIKPGGGGVVPGTDAPVSAVNAGDRRVLVECGNSKNIFPVTPTTTPVDIMKSAATCMSERIDVRSAVLLESFRTVGVQRPLRRYEHIRNVMNSWDNDRQNSLLLVDPGTGSSEAELDISGVPHEKPGDASWVLSYSQKVGKWDKRLITLKTDGQITMQKDPNKPQNQENVCHLDDFDIYTPTPEKLKKKIKPPKKLCYAIKSQQKSSMFESTQNFVHFFCTNDKQTADSFYAAVQGWRSWYLANVLGEGKKPHQRKLGAEAGDMSGGVRGHKPGESVGSYYQLGSFKPLLDTDQFDARPDPANVEDAKQSSTSAFIKSANQFDTTISPERRASTNKRKPHPPGSMANRAELADDEPLGNLGRRASLDQRRSSLDKTYSNEFASSGLLGRSYSHRQREAAERESQKQQPFTGGPSLLNGGYHPNEENYGRRPSTEGPRRTQSSRVKHAHQAATSDEMSRYQSTRTRGSSDLQRSGSKRVAPEMPCKPLVDLTPQYREPPQHVRKGKGHYPEMPGALIESATSPEDPLGIPPSTDWRGRTAQSTSGTFHSGHNRTPSVNRSGRPTTSRSPDEGRGAFTGEGLLANRPQGWGGGDRGRGYVDGSRAKGPLLDVTEPSKFAHGSLLNRVENEQGSVGPIIDRERVD